MSFKDRFCVGSQPKQLKKRSTQYKNDWWYDIEASSEKRR